MLIGIKACERLDPVASEERENAEQARQSGESGLDQKRIRTVDTFRDERVEMEAGDSVNAATKRPPSSAEDGDGLT